MTGNSGQDTADQTALAKGFPPVVVGVGASAAHVEGIERLLATIPAELDVALVLVVQHREALSEERLRQSAGSLPILDISDGDPIIAGNVYLCAPDMITTLSKDRFAVRQAERNPGERGTVDSFLVSLAVDRQEESIAVALHGTGGDGTLGFAAIKEGGGLTIAELERDTDPEHLSDSNAPAAISDFVLPVDDIGNHIAAYVRHLRRIEQHKEFDNILAASSDSLTRIAEILRNTTGNDFHGYKQNTFLRRVQRRMQVVQIDEIGNYVEFLRSDEDEVQYLFNDLLIGVTQFFRDKKEFEVLEREVIPRMFEGKDTGQSVRVWVLGCATGEEAYSIGILLREHMATLDSAPQVQIFATDIDGRALASARVGRYRSDIEKDISPERLARWFVREGDTYSVVKELREMCIFSQHNVIKDAPFSKLDLVSCRNLLIYLNAELQNRVVPLFHFALLPDRFLFLGNSEHVTRRPKLFVPIDRRARIFKKLNTAPRLPPEFPIVGSPAPVTTRQAFAGPSSSDLGLEHRAKRVIERHSPAYVVTDERFQVLHFSNGMGRFIEPTAGVASLELLSLVHRDLRLELRLALTRAMETGEPTRAHAVQLGATNPRTYVDIVVEPLQDKLNGPRHFVVVFKDGTIPNEEEEPPGDNKLVRTEHLDRLESELRSTRDRLQATIEELESTNEELKSSNEEYQSLNEELQPANEELETSREELQSVNEELTTVNGELAHRVQELTRATSDLKNFLESTQIATVFLDNDMRVMNFTPAVTQVLHLVETDVGRPIAHIKARIPIEELFDDARRVLRTLASVERELKEPDSGTRYIVRILPYRSVDNFIAGVVITFVDVTAITRAEERQRLLLAELQHRVRNTLAVVRSMARRTAATSDTVDDFAMHLDGRLNAFARVQAAVTRDPQAGIDLEQLVADELLAHKAHEGEQVEQLRGPSIQLQPKAAELIGLAVHELSVNAVKYGALSTPTGRLNVSWDVVDNPGELVFDWVETGVPLNGDRPQRRGFGSEMLERTLAYELNGSTTMEFTPDGIRCTLTIPLTERVRKPNGAANPRQISPN